MHFGVTVLGNHTQDDLIPLTQGRHPKADYFQLTRGYLHFYDHRSLRYPIDLWQRSLLRRVANNFINLIDYDVFTSKDYDQLEIYTRAISPYDSTILSNVNWSPLNLQAYESALDDWNWVMEFYENPDTMLKALNLPALEQDLIPESFKWSTYAILDLSKDDNRQRWAERGHHQFDWPQSFHRIIFSCPADTPISIYHCHR